MDALYTIRASGVPIFQEIEPDQEYIIREHPGYTIQDAPDDDMPIRRLQIDGEDILTTNQLLQVALGSVDGFEEILTEYGVELLTTLRSVPHIVEVLKIDHLKATRLLAILALGRRVFREPQAGYPLIRGAKDIFTRYRTMGTKGKEELIVALVNSRYLLVYDEVLAVGRSEILQIPAHSVYYPAILRQIHSLILIHNHPSGDATPSPADHEFTKRMQIAAEVMNVHLLDHVIIAGDTYTSMLSNKSGSQS